MKWGNGMNLTHDGMSTLMNEHIMGFKGRWKILGWVIHALWNDHYDMTIII